MSRASFNKGGLLITHSDPTPAKTCIRRIHNKHQKYHEHRVVLPECCPAYMFSHIEYKIYFSKFQTSAHKMRFLLCVPLLTNMKSQFPCKATLEHFTTE